MKKRYHFYIVAGILLIGLIIGSFLDLQINSALFNKTNVFGLIVSSFGMIPGYGTLAFFGGLLFFLTLKNTEFKKWAKAILFVVAIAMLGCAIYFLGKDVFSVNGFENKKLYWLGFVIMGVISCGIFYLGFFLGRFNKNPKMWLLVVIVAATIFIALVPGVTLFKAIMHRPRFRTVFASGYEVPFLNWWQRFAEYDDYKVGDVLIINGVTYDKEEFKSFPSGHAGATMCGIILLSYLPLVDNRLMKHQVLLFYIGFGWSLVVMFARSLVGAHYLSDTCFGALITLVCFYIGNEFVVRKCLPKEEVAAEPQVQE